MAKAGADDDRHPAHQRPLFKEPLAWIIGAVFAGSAIFALTIMPAPKKSWSKFDLLADWPAEWRFGLATAILTSVAGAGIVAAGLWLLGRQQRRRLDVHDQVIAAQQAAARKQTIVILDQRITYHARGLAARLVANHAGLIDRRRQQLTESRGPEFLAGGGNSGDWGVRDLRQLASALWWSTWPRSNVDDAELIDRQLLLVEVAQEILAFDIDEFGLAWPDQRGLESSALQLSLACESAMLAVVPLDEVELLDKLNQLLIDLAARIDTMLQRPQAGVAVLETLMRWSDPRTEVPYDADAVAHRLGFAGGLSDLEEPDARRQLLTRAPR